MQPIRRLTKAGPDTLTLGDAIYGPFPDGDAMADWHRIMRARTDLTAVTAREVFEGRVEGDAIHLVDAEALSFGMHPFREVHDVMIESDEGDVVLAFGSGLRFLSGDAVLVVQNAMTSKPDRHLHPARPLPGQFNLSDATVRHRAAHPAGGETLVVETDDRHVLVLWRRDGRMTIDLPVLRGHATVDYAVLRLPETMERFTPSARHLAVPNGRRPRDYQRELVYRFEGRAAAAAGGIGRGMSGIGECAELLARVYEESDLGAPPAIRLGRATQTAHSFYRSGEIVMCPHELHSRSVLHEAAHHLTDAAQRRAPQREREPGHGPLFVANLIGLLSTHEGADADAMLDLAREMGVDVDLDAVECWRERAARGLGFKA